MKQGQDKPCLIVFSIFRWDDEYNSTASSLLRALEKYYTIYWLELPFTLKDLVMHYNSEMIQRRRPMLLGKFEVSEVPHTTIKSVTPRFAWPINWLKPGRIYNQARILNEKAIWKTIKRLLKEENINEYYFLNIFAPFYGLSFPPEFKPLKHIYYSVDDISESEYVGKHGVYLEEKYVQQADLTLTTSTSLKRDMMHYSDHVELLANAADFGLFNKATSGKFEKPIELQNIDSPVIIYTGNICNRINYPLLIRIAEKCKNMSLVLVGPVNSNDPAIGRLKEFPNVFFAGRKNIDELPAFLQHADCGIIPFKTNKLTSRIYPLKVNEYLAAGIPVVSTPFSEDLKVFNDVVCFADQADKFAEAIGEEIARNNKIRREARISSASRNTWEKRAEEFVNLIEAR